MKVEQKIWTQEMGWDSKFSDQIDDKAQLVLVFAGTNILKSQSVPIEDLKSHYPKAVLTGCSTSGEIYGTQVYDDTLTATIIQFEDTTIETVYEDFSESEESLIVGERLGQSLEKENLKHVFLLSDGLGINGSELVTGITKSLPQYVTVTGGLSGDGDRFQETYVFIDGESRKNVVAAVGFYGERLEIGYGSLGGWDPFGPERLITRSHGNVLFELDGKPALELYKQYLGEHAKDLPSTGLLFPLSIRTEENTSLVRTILAVNEEDQSMTFAGNIPEGSYAKLMKANFDRLVDGAADAAKTSCTSLQSGSPDLAILISCVGRKLILKQRVEEEVESVRGVLGDKAVLTG
ncbi:MAG: FIST C-terminal domain-containing protein, partial [Candidatus Omnitrophica bacterium]|nr:FIST C-terminal domain-containing protein [Candidatus Omnitrophota bacterium]